jgi:hypothetical protein
MLNMAARLHADAVNATDHDDPAWAGRAASLAVTLTMLYQHTGDQQVLTQALRLATAAVEAGAIGAPHELAVFQSNLGNLHHEVFLRTGRVTDLDGAARLHLLALADLPERNPIVAGLLNNAAIALSDRYERLGDADDLRSALDAVERSLALSAGANPDRAARLNNLASMLIRLFELTGDPSALDLAAQQAQLGADRAVGQVLDHEVAHQILPKHQDRDRAALRSTPHVHCARPSSPGTTRTGSACCARPRRPGSRSGRRSRSPPPGSSPPTAWCNRSTGTPRAYGWSTMRQPLASPHCHAWLATAGSGATPCPGTGKHRAWAR